MSRPVVSCLLILGVLAGFARSGCGQNFTAYGNSNYAGVMNAYSNPAAMAITSLTLDVVAGGFDVTFNNSWVGVKRGAVAFPVLPESWRIYTPNVPGNIYKNFVFHKGGHERAVLFEQNLLLPSVMYRINRRNTVAFVCRMRQTGNISGVSPALANLFANEFDLGVLQNNPVQNRNFNAIRMTWMSYGFSYARVLAEKKRHRLSAGATLQLLHGLEAAYLHLRELDFLFSNKDTLSFLNAEFSTAHTERTGSILNVARSAAGKLAHGNPVRVGVDIGLSYEWKPSQGDGTGGVLTRMRLSRRARPYILRAGVAITDIGRLRFVKQPNYYDLNMAIRQTDIVRYIASQNVQMIDSLLRTDYAPNTGPSQFSVWLPTAVNADLDFSIDRRFFLNAGAHLTGFRGDELFKVKNYSVVWVTPRYESYWLEVAVPLTWNAMSAKRGSTLTPGITLKCGPLLVGTSDLTYFFTNEVSSVSLFFLLRVSLPVKPGDHPTRREVSRGSDSNSTQKWVRYQPRRVASLRDLRGLNKSRHHLAWSPVRPETQPFGKM